jgi:hypothetical protein
MIALDTNILNTATVSGNPRPLPNGRGSERGTPLHTEPRPLGSGLATALGEHQPMHGTA